MEVLALKNMNEYTVFISNGNVPGSAVKEEEVTISLMGNISHVLMGKLDSANANPKACWETMGAPIYPDIVQLAQIKEAAKLNYEILRPQVQEGKTDITIRLEAQSVVILKVR